MMGFHPSDTDYEPARKTDPDTSKDAAASVDTQGLEKLVLGVIRNFGHGGCISDDVCAEMPRHGVQTITPRFKRLLNKNLIVDTGERRMGRAGRMQRVMRAV